jgi:hypothetical protein
MYFMHVSVAGDDADWLDWVVVFFGVEDEWMDWLECESW